MRTQIVTAEDLRLTKLSAVLAEALESGGGGSLKKRRPGYVHAESIRPVDSDTERGLVEDRKPLTDPRGRRVMEMRNEVSALETLLASRQIQDSAAIQARIQTLKTQVEIMTAPSGVIRLG